MADVELKGGSTYERATTTSYNADDIIVSGAKFIEIWLDDEAIDFDISIQVVGKSTIEKPTCAGCSYWFSTEIGRLYTINVKSDSNANMQILVG